ncbi:hypothetical protein H1R20_g11064, partial [Candolleomyces eurysporus]
MYTEAAILSKSEKLQEACEFTIGSAANVDTGFGEDFANAMNAVEALQHMGATTTTHKHLIRLYRQKKGLRMTFPLFLPRNGTSAENDGTLRHPVGDQYAAQLTAAAKTHSINSIPFFNHRGARLAPAFLEHHLVGSVVEVWFSLDHYAVTGKGPNSVDTDTFTARIAQVPLLRRFSPGTPSLPLHCLNNPSTPITPPNFRQSRHHSAPVPPFNVPGPNTLPPTLVPSGSVINTPGVNTAINGDSSKPVTPVNLRKFLLPPAQPVSFNVPLRSSMPNSGGTPLTSASAASNPIRDGGAPSLPAEHDGILTDAATPTFVDALEILPVDDGNEHRDAVEAPQSSQSSSNVLDVSSAADPSAASSKAAGKRKVGSDFNEGVTFRKRARN